MGRQERLCQWAATREEAARRRLREARAECETLQAQWAAVEAERAGLEASGSRGATVAQAGHWSRHRVALREQARQVQAALAQAQTVVARRRAELVEARQDRAGLQRLAEARKHEDQRQAAGIQQRLSDDHSAWQRQREAPR